MFVSAANMTVAASPPNNTLGARNLRGVSGVADLPMLCRLWLISGNALENRLRVGKGAAGDVYLRVDLEGSFWTLYEFMSCGF